MRRGTLGESDTDVDDNTTHRFDRRTRSTITNPHNRTQTRRSSPTKNTGSRPANTTVGSTVRGAARRKMTFRQREMKQLREIVKLQKSTKLQIPKASFARVVREISIQMNPEILRYTLTALEALQEATEMFVTQVLQDAYLLTMHRKCVTLSQADMMLIRALKLNL